MENPKSSLSVSASREELNPNEQLIYDILNLLAIFLTFVAALYYLSQIVKYFQAQRLREASEDAMGNDNSNASNTVVDKYTSWTFVLFTFAVVIEIVF